MQTTKPVTGWKKSVIEHRLAYLSTEQTKMDRNQNNTNYIFSFLLSSFLFFFEKSKTQGYRHTGIEQHKLAALFFSSLFFFCK